MPDLTFASCYVYSPSGSAAASERSRLLCASLKAADDRLIFKYALRVRHLVAEPSPIAGFFRPNAVLVPIPGSAPPLAGTPTVAEHLAHALLREGLGQRIWPALRRDRIVRRSATAAPGARPSVADHYESFAIALTPRDLGLLTRDPLQVVLVDDVVTKGRTLLAAAARLQEACPNAQIRAFALLRTMGFVADVRRVLEPCVGEIRWRAGDALRQP